MSSTVEGWRGRSNGPLTYGETEDLSKRTSSRTLIRSPIIKESRGMGTEDGKEPLRFTHCLEKPESVLTCVFTKLILLYVT